MENKKDLEYLIENILFVYGNPLSLAKLASISQSSKAKTELALKSLEKRLKSSSGLVLINKDNNYQLVTSKEYAPFIAKLFKQKNKEDLSRAALEVLAIVAYQGPLTKIEIETIRGVNSSYIIRNLLMRGLINKNKEKTISNYELSLNALKSLGIEKQENLPRWQDIKNEIEKVKQAME